MPHQRKLNGTVTSEHRAGKQGVAHHSNQDGPHEPCDDEQVLKIDLRPSTQEPDSELCAQMQFSSAMER